MKHLSILGLGALLCLTMLLSCSDVPPTGTSEESSPPAIQSLRVSPLNVIGGSTVVATAEVTSPEGIPSEFEWSVTGGQLIGATIGPEVTWVTPVEVGTAAITCRALNRFGSSEQSTQIDLTPAETSPPGVPTRFGVIEINTGYPIFRHDDISPSVGGGCFIVGPFEDGIGEGLIAKLDENGNAEWTRLLRLTNARTTKLSVLAMPDGGCIVFGLSGHRDHTLDLSTGETGVYTNLVVRLDASGEIIWSRDIGGLERIQCSGAGLCPDGSILMIGSGDVPVVSKLSAGGKVLWRHALADEYNFEDYAIAWDITALSDGGILVAARLYWLEMPLYPPIRAYAVVLLKLSATGAVEWTKSFPEASGETRLMDVTDCRAGYLVAATVSASSGMQTACFTLQGLDYNGNVLWENPHTELQTGDAAIREKQDGGFYVASTNGYSYSICSFSPTGELIWSRESEFDFLASNEMLDVWECDGGYRALGQYRFSRWFSLIGLDRE